MQARVEIGELVDPVQHVADQLLEEDPRRHADLAAQLPRHGAGQLGDIQCRRTDAIRSGLRACWL